MYTVGRIGSYISRGVYTVSGPFHPFGGAVDIIVVEQPDGSFKSSPWYVRFGKFQGVLKTKEKVVSIDVNGVEADFHMYLDHKGEAYFVKEVDNEEGESVFYPSSSSDETDGQSGSNRRPMKSKNCNYDADKLISADQIDASNKKSLSRTNSRRAKILGLVFGRRSNKENGYREGEDGLGVVRLSSLDRAEIAANLLEVKWSTNLASNKAGKDNDSRFSSPDISGEEMVKDNLVNDEHSQVESLVRDDKKKSTSNSLLHKEIGSSNEQMANISRTTSVILESSVQEASTEVSSIDTKEQVVETSTLGESILEEKREMVSEISRRFDGFGVGHAYHDGCEEQTQLDSKIRCELVARDSKHFDEELACKEKDVAFPGCGISKDSESDRVQSFVYCETSESSGPVGSNGQTQGRLYLTRGGCGDVHVRLETHVTTELLPKDADNEFDKDTVEASRSHSDQMNAVLCQLDYNATDLEKPLIVQESSTQIVSVDPALCSIKEAESQNMCPTFSVNLEVQDGENIRNDLHQSLASIGDSQKPFTCNVLKKVASNSLSEISEEEQFLFGDLDEFKASELEDSSSPDCVKKVNYILSCCDEDIKEVNGSVNQTDESCSSPNTFVQYKECTGLENSIEESTVMSSPVDIPRNHKGGENIERLVESLPIMWSPTFNLSADATQHPLSHSLDSNSKSLKWTLLSENDPSCMKSDADEEHQLAKEQLNTENTQISEEINLSSPEVGDPSKKIVSPGGSWRIWPFSLSRSRSRKAMQPALSDIECSDAELFSECINDMDGAKSASKSTVAKKILRLLTPTSEQLASLNLKEGGNTVTFTFFTPMLGKQQVDARIFLWKWNTRIVISDVDGTITRSDVLGQFMPLVGMDWSQTGVAHLFSAIKENGYQLLFLSARAISQAYHTRRFLFNLKQDGKALPEGPVVISPDGLFPSLFREVIRRAPHEFKISCLEVIRALFPADCNPFYAGFGNRDTDEISYLKVGIPRGKIFTINPKGEIAVNRRNDTKSYSSLHVLVHGMFPPTTSSEQEDYNSWNFWRLPPPDIDI
ncbi:hypothetical protein Dsin_003308 [Dipteronia sinensis]|uniref:LNS2/PITP domain-containing protein n=1 Tax=Dipteronia sinensis TaxID=43782 RepID=A0AAE0EKT5_9ROSI|nr:hypothetical protein Dsin_003308 [Dipteronia sinensis]